MKVPSRRPRKSDPQRLPLPVQADAYLQWAFATGFRYFDTRRTGAVVLLVRFKEPLRSETPKLLWARSQIYLSDRYVDYRSATVTVLVSQLSQQLNDLLAQGAECFELAAPAAPAIAPQDAVITTREGEGPTTVVGIIDDGCPFAHMDYRRSDPGAQTVGFIWDQGASVPPGPPGPLGPVATALGYGAAFFADHLNSIVKQATIAGRVDEDVAYRLSGLPSLRSATSHGAQVMSHATGNARFRRQPLSFLERSDIAFVQLPPQALDDPSGGWLDHYALDGIHAIRSYARDVHALPATRQRVIVNLSYGPQTGPHNGCSILEAAIDDMKSQTQDYDFEVVLPSGNSHRLRTHAEFDLRRGGGAVEWCVAPDSQRPSFLEVWLPHQVSLGSLHVALISPTGERIAAAFEQLQSTADQTASIVGLPSCCDPDDIMVLMAIAPTSRAVESTVGAHSLAVPGRWKVVVRVRAGHKVCGVAHAYLARSDPNMGRATRGRSAYLDSRGYDPRRYLRESNQLDPNLPAGRAEVAARGSLNGIATGAKSAVAGGYAYGPQVPASYSSGGLSRGARPGPDWAYPTDESTALTGMLAGGNRSAAVMRLMGTSFAAPQYAREMSVNPGSTVLPAVPVKMPLPAWMKARAGGGLR